MDLFGYCFSYPLLPFVFNKNNPLASPSAVTPALKYGNVNTLTPSPGEVKGIIAYFIIFSFKG